MFISVQLLSHVRLFVTLWTAARQASLSFTISWSLLRLMSIELLMPSNHVILCRPLLLLPQSFPASRSFPVSQLFVSGGQSIGVSASSSVLPMNVQGWFAKYKCILWAELCPWNRCIEMLMIITCEWDFIFEIRSLQI